MNYGQFLYSIDLLEEQLIANKKNLSKSIRQQNLIGIRALFDLLNDNHGKSGELTEREEKDIDYLMEGLFLEIKKEENSIGANSREMA